MPRLLALLSMSSLLLACGYARPTTVRDLPPASLAPADDPVQRLQTESTVDGLVIALNIDGASVQLQSATLARIPRPTTKADESNRERVTVVGFAGGERVSEASAPDSVINASEEKGIVRLTKRQVVLLLEAPRALDTIEVKAPATNASGSLGVRDAYAPYCPSFNPDNAYCPRPEQGAL